MRADARLYVPSNPQPGGAADLCNALQVTADGMAMFARGTSCMALQCVIDRNGLMALEPTLTIWEAPDSSDPCWPGANAVCCIPAAYDRDGNVLRPGGLAVLARRTYSIDLSVRSVVLCSVGYSQLVGDLILNPCESNLLQITRKGVVAMVGRTDCVDLRVEAIDRCGVSTPTILAYPIIVDDVRNVFRCTVLGFSAMARDTSCIALRVIPERIGGMETRWLEAYPIICPSLDNALTCSDGGLGAYVDSSCTVALTVEAATIGCGGSKTLKGRIIVSADASPSVNAFSSSAGGLAAMVKASNCIEPVLVSDAASANGLGCGGSSRVMEFRPIVCSSSDNAWDCSSTGVGVYVADTCTVKLKVDTQDLGCGGSKVIKAFIIVAPDQSPTLNLTSQSAQGLASMVRASKGIGPQVFQESGGADDKGCASIPRVVRFQPILAPDDSNGLSCNLSGLASFISSRLAGTPDVPGPKSCIKLEANAVGPGGQRAIQPDMVIDTLVDQAHQALRCTGAGLTVLVEDTSCVTLTVEANKQDIDAIHARFTFSGAVGNVAHCRDDCGGNASGFTVAFRDMLAIETGNITFGLVAPACGVGGPDVVGCVKLATADLPPDWPTGCNGLRDASSGLDGLWSPPTTTASHNSKYSLARQVMHSGNATLAEIRLPVPVGGDLSQGTCNLSTCRSAIGIVVVRTPSAQFRLAPTPGASASGLLQYQGSIGLYPGSGAPAGSASYGEIYAQASVPGATVNGAAVRWTAGDAFGFGITGQTEVFSLNPIPPGFCIFCSLEITGTFTGGGQDNASAEIGQYALESWIFSVLDG